MVNVLIREFAPEQTVADQNALEQFLNSLEGEVVSIIPNVHPHFTMGGMGARVSFLYIVEKIA